jgi:hypothetical protein
MESIASPIFWLSIHPSPQCERRIVASHLRKNLAFCRLNSLLFKQAVKSNSIVKNRLCHTMHGHFLILLSPCLIPSLKMIMPRG